MTTAVIFDTETTGLVLPSVAPLDKQPRIIEVGAMLVNVTGDVLSEISQLINPGSLITEEITKITKLTNDDLAGKPSFIEVVPALAELFAKADVLIGHNLGFDIDMLANELRLVSIVNFPWPLVRFCTAQEYTPVIGHRPHLTTLYERIVGVPLEQTHRALDDVRALWEIVKKENVLGLL